MKVYPLYEGKEDNFQISMANYLDVLGLLWFHPANERQLWLTVNKYGNTYSPLGKKLKDKGVKRGVSDCMIEENNDKFYGLRIELKVYPGAISEDQQLFINKSVNKNRCALGSWSLDHAMECVDNYVNNKPINMYPIYKNSKGNYFKQVGLKLERIIKKDLDKYL